MDWLTELNEPQRRAVTHVDGPLLVLAGPGSGKTRVITSRIAYLIAQGISPWNILAITFTNKAAREMHQRVEKLHTPVGSTICTFHSLCARLLREFAAEIGLSPNYTIYDHNDQIKVVKEAMARLDMKTGNFTPSRIHGTISRAKNDLQSPDEFAAKSSDFYTRNVAAIYRQYTNTLAQNNALDFDDLLLRMVLLMRDRSDVRRLLGTRYPYVMVDEYQDTNRAQYILAHGIAMDHGNLCVTGDPDQSIYAWRGADINNILEFEADYPNATVVRLEENYRSVKPILDVASQLVAHNRMRKEKKLWTRRVGGSHVRVVICDDATAEAFQVVRRICEYRTRGGQYSDVAVFYRVNSLSRVMEQTLLKSAIPYRIARGVEFYARKEVKDVLGYLRVLINPTDDLSCQRIINTPVRGIGQVSIKRLMEFASNSRSSLREVCRSAMEAGLGPGSAKKVNAFCELMDELSKDLDRPVRDIMEDVVRKSGLEESLRNDQENDAYSNVEELISTAAEFDDTSDGGTLVEYLNQVSLVSDIDRMEENGGAITLMTLHAAKGLEFPVVFMIGFEDGLLPFGRDENTASRWTTDLTQQLEEERRLAFVGITRAKDELTITCARYRTIRGQVTPQTPSMFLDEIGTNAVQREDTTTQRVAPARSRGRVPRGGFYEDTEDRAIIEAIADAHPMPPEYEYLKIGSRICHPKFGFGKITKLDQPWPQTRATIQFQQYGIKKIVLFHAHLELA